MKLLKKLLILFLMELTVLFFIITFSGCEAENCTDCTNCFISNNEGTFCESDFDSTETFNETIEELINGGCECD